MINIEFRGAIGIHHTPLSDGPWDGPKAEANLKNDEKASYYRKAFAWVDPDGDPDVKASYKFIHHEVSSDGTIGAANIRACQTGIAVLNGARGGTTIPESDKKGVWNHLAAHLKDGDIEPPELKSKDDIEVRTYRAEVKADEEKPKISGVAAVFEELSSDLGGFKEIIHKGAFGELINTDDVFALINHDPNLILGRNKAGTLKLSEDEKGLNFVIDPPDTSYAKDLLVSMARKDIDKCSFAFIVDRDNEKWVRENNEDIRHIYKFSELWDISVVTYPAFPQTQAYLFDKRVLSPQQVYAEYRNKTPKQELLALKRSKLKIYQTLTKGE